MTLTKFISLIPIYFLGLCISLATFHIKAENIIKEVPRIAKDSLSKQQATHRKEVISNISYNLKINLIKDPDEFHGDVEISFDLIATEKPLTIDFSGGKVNNLIVNNQAVAIAYNNYFITLPPEVLKVGQNKVSIIYQRKYSTDGAGLHKSVDPDDKKTYLYSYLWPYNANRLFPSFDQPNLKATIELSVLAPKSWTVISSTKDNEILTTGDTSTWKFNKTSKLSTYTFSLHAGPYKEWTDSYKNIQLRLFSRQSLSSHVAVDEWFKTTKKGFKYYENYFGIPYPFEKYDQLIVPDTYGAMENIAAVTFSEGFIQRQKSSFAQRKDRSSVILHEMAHMWFGNLVTFDWWNGFWLNESFATFMAQLAMVETSDFNNIWHDFYLSSKRKGYYADSRNTTHPIEGNITNTSDIFLVFDSISYNKGASVLKQLHSFVGAETFRESITSYLKKHAFNNTTLEDFINQQSKKSGLELSKWAEQWLVKPGFNTLSTELKCKDGKIDSLHILQKSRINYPTIRHHKVNIAFYSLNKNGKLILNKVIPASISGSKTIIKSATGNHCPDVIYPNHDDLTFAKVILDETSVEVFIKHISDIDDSLTRSMLWQTIIDLTNDGKISLGDFIIKSIEGIKNESNIEIIEQLLDSVKFSYDRLQRLMPVSKQTLVKIEQPLLNSIWQQLNSPRLNADIQKSWFNLFLNLGAFGDNKQRMLDILNDTLKIPRLSISQTDRWKMLRSISTQGGQDVNLLIEKELNKDSSDYGLTMSMAAKAAYPDAEIKRHWLAKITEKDSKLGSTQKRKIINSIFPNNQVSHLVENLDLILSSLVLLSKTEGDYFIGRYISGLIQPTCENRMSSKLSKFISKNAQLTSSSIKGLKNALQSNNECLQLKVIMD